jgi:hypothetical protein
MTTTLQNLIDSIRNRANMEANEFVTDTDITDMLNACLGELDDALITRYEDYKVIPVLATLNSGQFQIPLPPDFLKLRALDYSPGPLPAGPGNGWYTINQFQMPERNRYNNSAQNIMSPLGKVTLSSRVMGQFIYMAPQDEAGGCYQVWYVPKFAPLDGYSDTLPYYMDSQAWSEFAVVGTCVKIMNKMNLDPSGFMAEKAEQKERVISAAKNRDSSGPKRMANVRFNGGGFGGGGFGGW